jgi:hypothetical protein
VGPDDAEWTARLLEATELAVMRLREDDNPAHRELIADLERLRARLAGESADDVGAHHFS